MTPMIFLSSLFNKLSLGFLSNLITCFQAIGKGVSEPLQRNANKYRPRLVFTKTLLLRSRILTKIYNMQ